MRRQRRHSGTGRRLRFVVCFFRFLVVVVVVVYRVRFDDGRVAARVDGIRGIVRGIERRQYEHGETDLVVRHALRKMVRRGALLGPGWRRRPRTAKKDHGQHHTDQIDHPVQLEPDAYAALRDQSAGDGTDNGRWGSIVVLTPPPPR
jgi:hypothetical protein